jgi:signal transduction histidine kinase
MDLPNDRAKILIVDDEPVNVLLMERLLQDAGYQKLASTTDPRQTVGLCREFEPDLVLLDLMMPHLDGLAVLGQLRGETPAGVYLPVLILTADATLEAKRRALAAGAHDFLTKPFEQFEVLLRIRNLLATRALYLALDEHNRALEETVRQRTERLLQSEKVAAMGSLLAGVAHELNNPLGNVLLYAKLLVEDLPPGDDRRPNAQRIVDNTLRCKAIVRSLLDSARESEVRATWTDLNDTARRSVEQVATEPGASRADWRLRLDPELPKVHCDAGQIQQVLVNLLRNAIEAIDGRDGAVTVFSEPSGDDEAVVFGVSDEGAGITDESAARLFEPFYTTKPQGTGLGLAICHGIVERHRGRIWAESPARGAAAGSTFFVKLPVGALS